MSRKAVMEMSSIVQLIVIGMIIIFFILLVIRYVVKPGGSVANPGLQLLGL